jgi:hypothetical protein
VTEDEISGHTVVTRVDGTTVVQHFGPGHVVEGSVQVIDVPAGYTVVIRHLS